jgi:hypothetical protein
MDAKLDGEGGTPPTWDLHVNPGVGLNIVPMIQGAAEQYQEALVAASLVLGGVPQNPTSGVDHLGFIGGTVTFGALDAQIRRALVNVGRTDYYADYDIVNHGLVVIPKKVASS